uniref:Uncharacterized protein n=1 Tax=Chromera velia CCMP2878 TaxID=1169474 RepID=A0A0G4FP39_9ALVE|eukprot:Cvel_3575.t1-p1 / transcript=Cvel_3575.t1 / gene=Cvel_3575 / organism=Chromera_velia_CCMP2878 / gene_product=hypothetical protein / transcript_product=hypothetical protein / location=Cvel_scaffold146:64817-67613(+) / protein_length=193 / sequence_SO=supercontig / SO=protein_coding / is_pseudo=false
MPPSPPHSSSSSSSLTSLTRSRRTRPPPHTHQQEQQRQQRAPLLLPGQQQPCVATPASLSPHVETYTERGEPLRASSQQRRSDALPLESSGLSGRTEECQPRACRFCQQALVLRCEQDCRASKAAISEPVNIKFLGDLTVYMGHTPFELSKRTITKRSDALRRPTGISVALGESVSTMNLSPLPRSCSAKQSQ